MRRLPGDPKDNGRLIKIAREEAGLSVKELAQKAGLSENSIRNAERGYENPTIKSLRRIELVTGSIRGRGHREQLDLLWTFSQLRSHDTDKIKLELHAACTNNGGWIPHEYLPLSSLGADTALFHYDQSNYRSTLEKQEAHLANISIILAKAIRKKRLHIICLTCGHGWIDLNFIRRQVELNEQHVVVDVIHPSHELLERGIQHAIAMFSGIGHVSLKFYVGDFESVFPMIVHQYDIAEYCRIVCILGPLDNYDRDAQLMRLLYESLMDGDLLLFDTLDPQIATDDECVIRDRDPRLNQSLPRDWTEGTYQRIRVVLSEHLPRPASISIATQMLSRRRMSAELADYAVELVATVDDGVRPPWRVSGMRIYRQPMARVIAQMSRIGWRLIHAESCPHDAVTYNTPLYLFAR